MSLLAKDPPIWTGWVWLLNAFGYSLESEEQCMRSQCKCGSLESMHPSYCNLHNRKDTHHIQFTAFLLVLLSFSQRGCFNTDYMDCTTSFRTKVRNWVNRPQLTNFTVDIQFYVANITNPKSGYWWSMIIDQTLISDHWLVIMINHPGQ